jgi:hypothetical protein
VAVQTFIVDNLATEYSQVWVSIKKITVLDAAGAEVTLLDATALPVVVNLSSLASVAQLMATVTIPAGIYTGINVTLDNAVKLVSLDGATTLNANFSATAGDFVWKVRKVSVDATASGQIVLDFNLAKFTYDASTGLVTPTMDLLKPVDAFKKFLQKRAEVHGTVQSVDAVANTVTINSALFGNGIVVSLGTDTVIMNEADGKVLTLADLTAGTRIEVKGTVTPGATTSDPVTVTATVIEVEPAAVNKNPLRGEGTITAISGNLVTISLIDANFLPSSNSLVLDTTSAAFAHGVFADLAVGVTIGFRGAASASGSAAQIDVKNLDVRGASSAHERDGHPGGSFSALVGTVTTLNADGSFTVTAAQAMGPFVQAGVYTVDPSSAYYAGSSASCVAVGATVDAEGSLSGTVLTAKSISVEGCGGVPHRH